MNIRVASREDVPEILRLERASFPDPWSEAMFTEELLNDMVRFVVVEGAAAGCAGAGDPASSDDSPKAAPLCAYMLSWLVPPFEAQIGSIAVDPEMRKRGLGKALMNDLFEQCEALGIEDVTLEVRVSNDTAIAMYESLGFVEEGLRPKYYDDGEDAILMCRHLGRI